MGHRENRSEIGISRETSDAREQLGEIHVAPKDQRGVYTWKDRQEGHRNDKHQVSLNYNTLITDHRKVIRKSV